MLLRKSDSDCGGSKSSKSKKCDERARVRAAMWSNIVSNGYISQELSNPSSVSSSRLTAASSVLLCCHCSASFAAAGCCA